ncbi:MAG: hypothetical protein ACI8RZ_007436 [Myxococcota bacterium]|jgi:hypothetical protein
MLIWLTLATATAETTYDDDAEGDVIATRTIAVPTATILATLSDIRNYPGFWPEGCVTDWEFGERQTGVGATAYVTYRGPLGWRRKLTLVVSEITTRRVDIDHPGNKGFVTTYAMTPAESGTGVEMHTWIYAPPKPFKKAYFNRIHPHFQSCHDGFLEGLAKSVE